MPVWNDVYTDKKISNATPCDVLVANEHLLPKNGRALDYACGLAGNGIYLAKQSYDVTAWDLSEVAVNKINEFAEKNKMSLKAEAHDLENNLPDIKNHFDIVVVSYFLHRETLRYLYDVLKEDGILFYQTFSGRQFKGQGPSKDAFRLKQNELLDVFSDMQLMFYREDDGCLSGGDSKQGQTYFVAKK